MPTVASSPCAISVSCRPSPFKSKNATGSGKGGRRRPPPFVVVVVLFRTTSHRFSNCTTPPMMEEAPKSSTRYRRSATRKRHTTNASRRRDPPPPPLVVVVLLPLSSSSSSRRLPWILLLLLCDISSSSSSRHHHETRTNRKSNCNNALFTKKVIITLCFSICFWTFSLLVPLTILPLLTIPHAIQGLEEQSSRRPGQWQKRTNKSHLFFNFIFISHFYQHERDKKRHPKEMMRRKSAQNFSRLSVYCIKGFIYRSC